MNSDIEARRIRELTAIVGPDAVSKYAFYDNIEYHDLTLIVRIQSCGDRMATLKELRQTAATSTSALLAALKKANGEPIHTVDLSSIEGCMQKWKAVRSARRVKRAVFDKGGTATIDLHLDNSDFHRSDCQEEEINYLETRLITWM